MWFGKVNELIGSSDESFEAAVRSVLRHANRSLRGITGITILEKRLRIDEDRVSEYRVRIRLSFDMAQEHQQHW